MLYAKWKYDYACTKREMQYIAKISRASNNMSINDYLGNVEKTLLNKNVPSSGVDFSEFGIGYHKNGFGDDDYYVWYVYATNDDIY